MEGVEPVKRWALERETELRFEVGCDKKLFLKLLKGTAEVFGKDLAIDREYSFTDSKAAVYTWHGCELELKGAPAVVYTANETPMTTYINTHACFDKFREEARVNHSDGPRVMVVGPSDSGKSSLCRILLNYACRRGWKPTYIDVDVGQNGITLPGSMAAVTVDHPFPADQSCITLAPPIAYYYGHTTPLTSVELYNKMAERLAEVLDSRFKSNELARYSGAFINTCGLVDNAGYALLIHLAKTFRVNAILVIGQDRLCSELQGDVQLKEVTVVKVPKSGGVVERDANMRRRSRNRSIRQYFFGVANELCPHPKVLSFKEVNVFRVGGGPKAPSTTLPLGSKRLIDPNQVVRVGIDASLVNTILAVSYATAPENLLKENVAGFVVVTAVDTIKQRVTLLCPSGGHLPSNLMLSGSQKWADSDV